MRKVMGMSFLLIAGFSLGFSNDIFSDLYQKNDLLHINLLRNSVFFDQQNNEYDVNIIENYYIGNFPQFIEDFNKKFTNINVADNQLRFFYLASKFRLAEYSALKDIIPNIDAEKLSIENWRDFQKIKVVSYYFENNGIALNNSIEEITTDNRTDQVLLGYVSKINQLQVAGQGILIASGDVDVNYYLAWNNLKVGNYEDAINLFDKASKGADVTDIRKEMIDYGVGVTLYASGDKELASKQFDKAYSDNNIKESALFFKLLMKFDDNKFGDVVSSSSEFLFMNPNSTFKNQFKYLNGASQYYMGNKQQAKKTLEEIKDFNIIVKYLLADIYYDEGSYLKSKVYYKDTYDKSNNMLGVYAGYGYAWSCFKLFQYKEAENILEKLILDKNLPEELRFNMMIKSADSSYNSGNYKDAARKYREFLTILSGNVEIHKSLYKQSIYNLAKVYIKLKDYKRSNEILDKYNQEVKNESETVIIKIIMANNLYQLKNYKEAGKIYEEILLVYNSYQDEDVYISLADSLYNNKEYSKALVVYQDYFKVYPKGERDLDASYGMVQTLYQLKDFDSATELAKQVDEKYGIGLVTELESKIKFNKESISE